MIDTDHPEALPPPSISARSKRQAMDWSLALASQGIAATILKGERGWELTVDPPDLERARNVLRQYESENRGWRWQPEWLGAGIVFHWGAGAWVAAVVAIYYWSMVRFPWLKSNGMVDSAAVLHGQWWRVFTAVTLHENLGHLLSNAGIGFLLLGLAMGRYGPGVGALAAFLAGVAGNCAGVLLEPHEYYSLGASGMVTGALGLVTVQSFAPWRKYHITLPMLPRAIAAGVLILVLIGFSPGSDQVAHVGGFLAGAALGLGLGWIRPAALHRLSTNVGASVALGALVLITWLLASRR
jgi:rhomboid protease GluP